MKDSPWMERALSLARRGEGLTRPNPPVGAVVVKRGEMVGEGYHRRAGGPHAERVALKRAGVAARGATLYVTLEPCSTQGRTGPCVEAIREAGIRRVVAAIQDPNPLHRGKGFRALRGAGIDVSVGAGRAAATRLIAPFAKWVTQRRPLLTLKLGMTLDGRIADAQGHSKWITGVAARARVQEMRKRVDAVMVGSTTVCRDDPSLVCRKRSANSLYRVVVDSRGRMQESAQVLSDAYAERTIVAVTDQCSARRRKAYEARGAQVWVMSASRGRVSLKRLMRRLGKQGVLHVLCEGGGELAAGLVRENLVDRYCLFMAPTLLGGTAIPAVGGVGWPLKRAPKLKIISQERIGDDLLVEAEGKSSRRARGGRSSLRARLRPAKEVERRRER